MSYADLLADMPIALEDDDTRTLGTLCFAVSHALAFVLTPEAWPVFVAWYGGTIRANEDRARAEMQDMLTQLRAIGLAGSL